MDNIIAVAGNTGPRVRSDCELRLELKSSGGININLDSRVKSMYGNSIVRLFKDGLAHFGIKNAKLEVKDSGALPFVLMARLEAVIKTLSASGKEFLPDFTDTIIKEPLKERFRFSRLYLPGNTPSMMLNASLHSPDGIILDLEDSVAPDRKHEARFLVRNALRQLDFGAAERMVRINQGDTGFEDLKYILPHYVHLILVPKCESADYLLSLESEMNRIKAAHNLDYSTYLMPIIESALGVENSFNIASASPSVVALAIGLEDLTADLGVQRTNEGNESLYARMRIVNAARAAGIQAIDSVFSDVNDMDALRQTALTSKSYGFEGMGCIHPRQIQVIKEAFIPDKSEIEKAARIVTAFREAESKGLGVVSLGSKMIDPPVVKRALRTINLAEKLNIIPEDQDKISNE